ncbi:hypothetical protein EN45_041220 [Penicillium chrysogenum]|uniref:Uncharacterized protein n=1 Tax=Penicillium chrysogenum TaxID=5076 RepID=A0A169XCU9_PENCH|nr:hypothetical protein EN45_041220 [Penicillium chrysogenum]
MEGDTRSIQRKADVGMTYDNLVEFGFYPGEDSPGAPPCSDYNVTTHIYQDVDDGYLMQWDSSMIDLGLDVQTLLQAVCYPAYNTNSKREIQLEGAENSFATPATPGNSSITEEAEYHSLHARSESYWDLKGGSSVGVPNTFFGLDDAVYKSADNMMNKNRGKIGGGCTDCVGCADDPEDQNPCCGCACMDCIYGYSDLQGCDSCDEIPSGTWPWDDYLDISIRKRESFEENSGDISPDLHRGVSHVHRGISHLHRRLNGIATISPKKVTVCSDKWWADGGGLYPAFPALAANSWDGIQNGKWDSISRYWGNSSDSCTSWGVFEKTLADEVWVGPSPNHPSGSMQRAQYQTEHVFEGQLIGDFFTWWLDQGKANAYATKSSTSKNISCANTEDLFTTQDNTFPWKIGIRSVTFIEQVLYQLGNVDHLDRLTIFMGRPNLRKGILFSGKSNDLDVFKSMTADQQVLSAKELGMVFNYMNEQVVWDKFCATYEAIYTLLGQWQTYYNNNPNAPLPQGLNLPNLQDEWQAYINTALDLIVSNGKSTFNQMHAWSTVTHPSWAAKWGGLWWFNKGQIRMGKSCPNLSR